MKLAWATDVHLNFVGEPEAVLFCQAVERSGAEALLLAGDIAEGPSVAGWLEFIAGRIGRPIYFVLGNHDYYHGGGGIDATRQRLRERIRGSSRLCWLDLAEGVALTPDTALVGHSGWADGRYGSYATSRLRMNDHLLIGDFLGRDHWGRARLMEQLGDEAADHLRRVLPPVLASHAEVLLLTHIPPFAEACQHEGRQSGPEALPHFSCKAVGDLLLELIAQHPERRLTVLCGHTHAAAEVWPLPNLRVVVGGAEYGRPELQALLEVR
jgi:3',5'-cyclic AMP phosphodiesterase CpdA